MEAIKVSPNVEFEIIYADGERKRVPEGVLYGVEEDGSITLHNGTDCAAVWFAVTGGMLIALNDSNALPAFVLNRLLDPNAFYAMKKLAEEVLRNIWLDTPATFRLGQMDFQQVAVDILEDAADQAESGWLSNVYLQAAALIRDVKIPE